MLLPEKLLKKLVPKRIKKFLMPLLLKRKKNQNNQELVTMALPRKKPIKKLTLHSAHLSSLVCAEYLTS